jgi:hypothetical protein
MCLLLSSDVVTFTNTYNMYPQPWIDLAMHVTSTFEHVPNKLSSNQPLANLTCFLSSFG